MAQPRGDFCDGAIKAIDELSFSQVVKGSSPLSPTWLGLEELAQCHAVLTDCVHLAWDLLQYLGAVVFSRVTNNVVLEAPLLVGVEGHLKATLNLLFCSSCEIPIGFHLYSTMLPCSVQSLSCVGLCDLVNRSTQGLPVHHQLPEFTQTHLKEKIMLTHTCLNSLIQTLKELPPDQSKLTNSESKLEYQRQALLLSFVQVS
ncbi:hypothetical protein FD755_001374 [Muntiacus reevesi]|uniref:Yippee/Mis18/Cereblon domain-containing protein n=1 Tax=Muntiacus reevesi TaxID=9886 RepID=A0A5J5N149_MUNRE|nr:hypothetical protein FD755_001374 [Muntiacus reevesi]